MPKPAALAAIDAPPNYRAAAGDLPTRCSACRFYLAGKCSAYDFAADGDWTCDAFEAPLVLDDKHGAEGGHFVSTPALSDGQRSIDDVRGEFLDRGERGVRGAKAGLAEGSDGKWITINGVHFQVGNDGRIVRGPEHTIGKRPEEIRGDPGGGTGAQKKEKRTYSGPSLTETIKAQSRPDAVVISGKELGEAKDDDEIRDLAESYARQHLQGKGPFKNPWIEKPVQISGRGIGKVISSAADVRRAHLVPAIPLLIERGVPVGPEEKPTRSDSPYEAFRRFNVQVEHAGKPEAVNFLIGRDHNGNWYYNHGFGEAQ